MDESPSVNERSGSLAPAYITLKSSAPMTLPSCLHVSALFAGKGVGVGVKVGVKVGVGVALGSMGVGDGFGEGVGVFVGVGVKLGVGVGVKAAGSRKIDV